MAIPSRVECINGGMATVQARGLRREVSLMLLGDEVAVGDYVLVQQGNLAYERLDATSAQQTLALMDEVLASAGDASLRVWG
jgi:hydrogenase expression/formation protein HypC